MTPWVWGVSTTFMRHRTQHEPETGGEEHATIMQRHPSPRTTALSVLAAEAT